MDDEGDEPVDSLLAAVAKIPERAVPIPEATPGTKIGRYELVRLRGAGGMGVVWEALDPALDRRVALKLMRERRDSDGELAERLRREAQTLAKLSHGNVVAVYDVGLHDADLYVVMQLVEGVTLDRDLASRPRDVAAIVERFAAAGRGLAAAHAAGIVHRDFKPTNVLVGDDGVVRVSDFGLARATRTGGADHDKALEATTTSNFAGTPAYMAPEQFTGGDVSPATDQFAFCIALWEALYGERPFAGATFGELAGAVTRGHRTQPPEPRRVPAWLHRTLARGLATDPATRWPSMTALVDQLVGVPRRRRRAVLVGAMVAIVGVTAVGVWLATSQAATVESPPCVEGPSQLAGVWDATVRERAQTNAVAVDRDHGAARFAAAAPLLDRYAADWLAIQTEGCRANRITGRESDALYDRQMRCLDRRRGELAKVAQLLAGARALSALDRAVVSAHELTDLAACADLDALGAALPPPEDPAQRHAADQADEAIAAVERDRAAGQLAGLDARALAAVERARATRYAPVLARALRVRARVVIDTTNVAAAAATLRELTEVAAQAHDDVTASWAWSHLLITVGWDQNKTADAVALLPAARAAALRAGNGADQRVDFLYAESGVLFLDHHIAEAHAALDEARAILVEGGAGAKTSPKTPRLADIAHQSGSLFAMDGKPVVAEPLYRRAIALYSDAYGADHPEVAYGWQSLGDALRWQGRTDDALAAYREAIRIRTARLGDKPALAKTLVTMAAALIDAGRSKEAMAPIDHAIAILRGGEADVELATALMMKSSALDGVDKLDDARRVLDESIALFERLGGQQNDLPVALNNRAALSIRQNRCDQALVDLGRAIELAAKYRGADHPLLVDPLVMTGACLLELHRPAEAIAPLERALALHAEGVDAATALSAKFYRGRALYESNRDRAAGVAAAREARDALAAMKGDNARARQAEADAWLREHPR
jgi:tetratricopeptide (TPR) repeat protein